MASYDFVTVDVFTDKRFGGNPLAVFPDARGLDAATMQRLAKEFNLAETTFVLPPENSANDARVRIFTPATEMPFAGHPNVGTAFVLATRAGGQREHYRFEGAAGLVEVTVTADGAGTPTGAEVSAPLPLTLGAAPSVPALADCVGLAPGDIATGRHAPVRASMGAGFVIVEVASDEALIRALPDHGAFRRTQAALDQPLMIALYWRDPARDDRLRVRMFAPLDGVPEDPATGSAAVALAGLLLSLDPDRREARFAIEQGAEIGRPSFLAAVTTRDAAGAIRARVGGRCVPVLSGVATV